MSKHKSTGKKWERKLSVPDRHQLRIARETLKLHDAMVAVMGGPSKAEAREIIRRYEMEYGRNPGSEKKRNKRTNPRHRKAANPSTSLMTMALAGAGAYLFYKYVIKK